MHTVMVHSSTNNEDDKDQVQSPAELRRALWEMSRIPNTNEQSASNAAYSSIPDLENLTLESSSIEKESSPNRITQDYPEYPGRVINDNDITMTQEEDRCRRGIP